MSEKCYLVLSLREINQLKRIALKGATASYGKTRDRQKHCIILEDLELATDINGRTQIRNTSLFNRVLGGD